MKSQIESIEFLLLKQICVETVTLTVDDTVVQMISSRKDEQYDAISTVFFLPL